MMKYFNKIWIGAIAAMVVGSCADDSKLDFYVEKPESLAVMEYLDEYDVLKSYVDRNANPNFKLGAGVSVADFNKLGRDYSLIVSNFDDVTAGWEMKHGGVVQDNGSMNLDRVRNFIKNTKEAGISVYGHTLVWHTNQNSKYLNSIIADREIEIDPNATVEVVDGLKDYAVEGFTGWVGGPVTPVVQGGVLVVTNPTAQPNFWDVQYHVASGIPTKIGTKHKVTLRIKGTVAAEIRMALGDWGAREDKVIQVSTDWQDVVTEFTGVATNSFIMIQSGHYVGTYEIQWVKVTHQEAAAITWWTNLVRNSDVEGDDVSSFFATEVRVGPAPATIGAAGTGADGVGRAIVVKSGNAPANDWDTQFFVKAPRQLKAGEKYRFSMKIKADKPATMSSQSHNNPGGYVHWAMVGSPSVTTEWKEYTNVGAITADQAGANGMNTIAFNLAVFKEANTYYFDDIVWEVEESGNKKPLTPEEKKDTLTWALNRWISSIMEISKSNVKAWDVVNEPMDDGSPYNLKTGIGKTLPDGDFYWQDYLGKDYAVEAFKMAAQYGNNDDKLFINDYNLEYNLDKCRGIIAYVEYIESKGARVDGIGTQMHISINSDKQKITQMFELLAATGKLIKISELDMGVGKQTTAATDADYIAQAEMYNFVIKEYFRIIPAPQRYGITFWSPLDSPAGSSWRAGEPIGLWNLKYQRKRAYGGAANAFAGKNVVE